MTAERRAATRRFAFNAPDHGSLLWRATTQPPDERACSESGRHDGFRAPRPRRGALDELGPLAAKAVAASQDRAAIAERISDCELTLRQLMYPGCTLGDGFASQCGTPDGPENVFLCRHFLSEPTRGLEPWTPSLRGVSSRRSAWVRCGDLQAGRAIWACGCGRRPARSGGIRLPARFHRTRANRNARRRVCAHPRS